MWESSKRFLILDLIPTPASPGLEVKRGNMLLSISLLCSLRASMSSVIYTLSRLPRYSLRGILVPSLRLTLDGIVATLGPTGLMNRVLGESGLKGIRLYLLAIWAGWRIPTEGYCRVRVKMEGGVRWFWGFVSPLKFNGVPQSWITQTVYRLSISSRSTISGCLGLGLLFWCVGHG